VSPSYNGWDDDPESIREMEEYSSRRDGWLIYRLRERIRQSQARIARTARKWKEMAA
jgi:hypothetical protein